MVFLTSGRGPDGGGGGQFETSKFSFEDPSLDPSIFSFICEKVFYFYFFSLASQGFCNYHHFLFS